MSLISVICFLSHQVKAIFTPGRTACTIFFVYVILLLSAAPVYSVNSLEMKFSFVRNKTLLGLVFGENREYVQKFIFIFNNFLIPVTAFIVIVICTVILVVRLHNTGTWRTKSTTSGQSDKVSSRNRKVAKMVVIISTVFIVCFIPICVAMFAVAFEPSLIYGGSYTRLGLVLVGLGFVLESVNSSGNIFIYYYVSSNFKDTFRKIFLKERN